MVFDLLWIDPKNRLFPNVLRFQPLFSMADI
jgi:hypothetical protein